MKMSQERVSSKSDLNPRFYWYEDHSLVKRKWNLCKVKTIMNNKRESQQWDGPL